MPTIQLALKPGVYTQVEIDDRNLLFHAILPKLTCPAGRAAANQLALIQEALNNPIGSPSLDDLLHKPRGASAAKSVVVLVDDITRPTPAATILPPLLARIEGAGIPDDAVRIFMALGTHRPMTPNELLTKLGRKVLDRYQVVNRDYREGDFVPLGTTESGTPIEVDRQVVDADVKIGIGNIVPHVSVGWGGGSKIILPGVCSQRTSDRMHLMACIVQPVLEVLGRRDNKPRGEMDAIAGQLGLDWIVNTVLDEDKNIVGLFAGHFIEAHRQAVSLAEQVLVAPIPALADIVIVSATPCSTDYWQGIKPYVFAHLAVREGGVIILLLDGEERLCGDAPSHEETVRKYMLWSFEDQKAAVERGEVHDLVGLNVPMYHASVRHRLSGTICVSPHLLPEDLDVLGFDSAPSVQAALEQAYAILGRDARVGVIPYGGETLVRVGSGGK